MSDHRSCLGYSSCARWGINRQISPEIRKMIRDGVILLLVRKGTKGETIKVLGRVDLLHRSNLEYSNALSLHRAKIWWAVRDSNLRLPPCEDGTLTTELTAHLAYFYSMPKEISRFILLLPGGISTQYFWQKGAIWVYTVFNKKLKAGNRR